MALKRKLSTSSESTASMMPALLRYASSASASAGAYELIKKGNNQNKWKRTILHSNPKASMMLQTVWTPTLCIPDTSDRPGYFLISLSNLATPLITYGAPCITLLCSTFITTLLHI